MSQELHKISFELGEIRGLLSGIEKNTSDIKSEVKSVSGRVTKIEDARAFESGVDSQNKKIAAGIGSLAGMAAGAFITWLSKVFS